MRDITYKRRSMLDKTNTEIDSVIRIQGTMYDKKRKISDRDLKMMRLMYKKGVSQKQIAMRFGVSCFTTSYYLNETTRDKHMKSRNGIHTGNTVNFTRKDRIERKKAMIILGHADDQIRRIENVK